jgi:hypothetical protein
MTPNPKAENKPSADRPNEVDPSLADPEDYRTTRSTPINPILSANSNEPSLIKPSRNPKDHQIDGAE